VGIDVLLASLGEEATLSVEMVLEGNSHVADFGMVQLETYRELHRPCYELKNPHHGAAEMTSQPVDHHAQILYPFQPIEYRNKEGACVKRELLEF